MFKPSHPSSTSAPAFLSCPCVDIYHCRMPTQLVESASNAAVKLSFFPHLLQFTAVDDARHREAKLLKESLQKQYPQHTILIRTPVHYVLSEDEFRAVEHDWNENGE